MNINYNCPVPVINNKKKYVLYNIYIGSKKLNYIKIGTTNNPERRFKEISKYYDSDIIVNWISPPMTKYSALRFEDRFKEEKKSKGWLFVPNDKFIKPVRVKEEKIKIRKEYEFSY